MSEEQQTQQSGKSGFQFKPWMAIVGVIGILLILVFTKYNGLVSADEEVAAKWSEVENQYERKYKLIPNLVAVAKNYAEFEQETLTQVVEARAQATSINLSADELTPENIQRFEAAQSQLNGALSRLLVTFERYPDLKANENYLRLQDELSGTENRIAVARRNFIEEVKKYNKKVRSFPANITAAIFGFERKATFEASEDAMQNDTDVDDLFDE